MSENLLIVSTSEHTLQKYLFQKNKDNYGEKTIQHKKRW